MYHLQHNSFLEKKQDVYLNSCETKSSSCSDSGMKRCPPSSMQESSAAAPLFIEFAVTLNLLMKISMAKYKMRKNLGKH